MAKRFSDTEKWKKSFIRGLSPELKLLWFYMLDDCDIAGLWTVDWEIMEIRTGCKIKLSVAKGAFVNHIVEIDNGEKWFVPSFIEFQYGPELSKNNNIYKSINKILNKYDLYQYLTVPIVEEGTTPGAYRGRISQKIRDKIYLEADCTCEYCQERKSISELCVDHFIPLKKGGDNNDENLICSCTRCNQYKTDLMPNDFLGRPHIFLNPTNKIKALIKKLEGAFKTPEGGKDKDKDKDIGKGYGQGEGNGEGKGQTSESKILRETETDLTDYEKWTQDVEDNNDFLFGNMVRNSGVNIPAGRFIGLVKDHLALLARYPKMRPQNQQAFRYSLLKHITENKDKQVQNGAVNGTNKTASHGDGLIQDFGDRHGN